MVQRILVAVAVWVGVCGDARGAGRGPEKVTLATVWVAESQPHEFLLVVNGAVGFRSVAALERYVAGLPAGSTLTWAPSCCRIGGEPLSGAGELEAFRASCKAKGVELVVVPAG